MDPKIILIVFAFIFIAELPDKSLFASLILSTKYPKFLVWLGAAAAFAVHVILAVTAGKFLTLLPDTLHAIIVAALFFIGAAIVLLGKHGLDDAPEIHHKKPRSHNPWKVFAASFGVVFIGEWGDITQIATANYAAAYHNALSVAIGAILGLWAVTALAIVVGAKALNFVPPIVLQRITGGVLILFGLLSLKQLL